MTDGPVIRNLSNLSADMRDALRDALHALYDPACREAGDEATKRMIAKVEMKIRRVLELLTGSRD
jgi:hypothetical protein